MAAEGLKFGAFVRREREAREIGLARDGEEDRG